MTDLNYNKFEAIARQAKVNLLVTTLRHCAVLVMPGMVRPSDLLVRAEAWTDSDWAILEQLCGAELKHTASATTRAAVVEALREMAQDEQEHDIARRPGWELRPPRTRATTTPPNGNATKSLRMMRSTHDSYRRRRAAT